MAYNSNKVLISSIVVRMLYSIPITGLIISGGLITETSIQTFPVDSNCTIPPFPGEGNLSFFSFYIQATFWDFQISLCHRRWCWCWWCTFRKHMRGPGIYMCYSNFSPPKGDTNTPSLSSTTGVNLWRAEADTRRLLAYLGAVAKMNGLNTQHWGNLTYIRWYSQFLFQPREVLACSCGDGKLQNHNCWRRL